MSRPGHHGGGREWPARQALRLRLIPVIPSTVAFFLLTGRVFLPAGLPGAAARAAGHPGDLAFLRRQEPQPSTRRAKRRSGLAGWSGGQHMARRAGTLIPDRTASPDASGSPGTGDLTVTTRTGGAGP